MRRLFLELETSLGDGRELFECAMRRAEALKKSGTIGSRTAFGGSQ
jgi:hypothetical protein